MILNLGSVNVDHVHRVAHFPAPGETLADQSYAVGLGGKGANQSIAIARAGGQVRHLGAVGRDGEWARERLAAEGVDVSALAVLDHAATGHAVIYVDPKAENMIVIHGGANRALDREAVLAAVAEAGPGGWFLTQAETAHGAAGAAAAKARGLRVAYAAAPFDPAEAAGMLPHADLLAVNEGEAAALAAHLGCAPAALPVPAVLMTLGAAGAVYRADGREHPAPRFEVEAVDTTGAGDCFLGTFLAALDLGDAPEPALRRAAAAAALSVTRPGAADAMPSRAEVDAFLEERG